MKRFVTTSMIAALMAGTAQAALLADLEEAPAAPEAEYIELTQNGPLSTIWATLTSGSGGGGSSDDDDDDDWDDDDDDDDDDDGDDDDGDDD